MNSQTPIVLPINNPYVYSRPLTEQDKCCIVPELELHECLTSILQETYSSGIDLFGPRRTGKSTFINILLGRLRAVSDIVVIFLDCSVLAEATVHQLIELIKEKANIHSQSRGDHTINELDDLSSQFYTLALECTNNGMHRAVIVIDGVDALSRATWSNLLYAIRRIHVYARHQEASAVGHLRWVIAGTKNMFIEYAMLSFSATPFSPFRRLELARFTISDVRKLFSLSDEYYSQECSDKIYKRTNGYKRLTQQYLYELFRFTQAHDRKPTMAQLEDLVLSHNDPNWSRLVTLTENDKDICNGVKKIANGECLLDMSPEKTSEMMLGVGIFIRDRHEIIIGNPHYRDRIRSRWRSKPRSQALTTDRQRFLEKLRNKSQNAPKKLFISYSHQDEKYMKLLYAHLKILERENLVEIWHDGRLKAGDHWKENIINQLNNADIILFLISSDFIASDFCYDIEIKNARKRHDKGECLIVPIIVRACEWNSAYLSDIQALPKGGDSISQFTNLDDVLSKITAEIRLVAER